MLLEIGLFKQKKLVRTRIMIMYKSRFYQRASLELFLIVNLEVRHLSHLFVVANLSLNQPSGYAPSVMALLTNESFFPHLITTSSASHSMGSKQRVSF